MREQIESLLYEENVQCDEGIKRLVNDIMEIVESELKTYSYKDCDGYVNPIHEIDFNSGVLKYN